MIIEQVCNGVELKEFDMKNYHKIHNFVNKSFAVFYWNPYKHSFFISDSNSSRSEVISKIKENFDV